MNPRLRVLLDSRSLLEHSATDAEVAAMWEKALQTMENSRRGLDPSVEFTVAYTAALQTALALLYACGYRPVGRDHTTTPSPVRSPSARASWRGPRASWTSFGWGVTRRSTARRSACRTGRCAPFANRPSRSCRKHGGGS